MSAGFDVGSAVPTAIDGRAVQEIVAYLAAHSGATVTVNGYASSEGDPSRNQLLSERRAEAFKAHLVAQGVSADRVTAAGRGIENPKASNDTEAGRRKNRRVEITY